MELEFIVPGSPNINPDKKPFNILVYLLAGVLVGKYINKDKVTHNHEKP